MTFLIKKAFKDLNIYQNYTFRIYKYFVDNLGWINNPIGILVQPKEIHHYYNYSDELEVYYTGRLLSRIYDTNDVLFLAGNYYSPNDDHDWLFIHQDWDFY